MAKTTKTGAPRKPRTKDNTMELFPALKAQADRINRIKRALKAVKRVWEVEDQWPAEDTAMLIKVLSGQVQPPPPSETAPVETDDGE